MKKFQKLTFLFRNAVLSIYRFFSIINVEICLEWNIYRGWQHSYLLQFSQLLCLLPFLYTYFYDMKPIWLSMSHNMKLLLRNTIIKALLSKLWNLEHPKLDLLVVSWNEFLKGIHICFIYFLLQKISLVFAKIISYLNIASYWISYIHFIIRIVTK